MKATVNKPVFYDISHMINNTYELIAERPRISINTKEKFLQRGIELGLFEIQGNPKDIKIKAVVNLLNDYLSFDGCKILYTKKSVYYPNSTKKYCTEYKFTVIEIN